MVTEMGSNKYWGLLCALGILLIIVGIFAIGAPYVATFASILTLGWLLIFAGIIQFVYAFAGRHSDSFLLQALLGLFNVIVGLLMVTHPTITAMTLTLLLATFFLVLGIFRIFSSAITRFPNWGWVFFSGVLALILGILILVHWPSSALWVIGLFIGIDFLFTGWAFIISSFAMRKVANQRPIN